MSQPAIHLLALQATLDPEAAAQKQFRLRVHSGLVRLSEAGVAGLLPPHLPLTLLGIRNGHLRVRFVWNGRLSAVAEVLPEGTPAGNLRLRFTSLVAGGFLPLPAETVLGFLLSLGQSRLPRGIYVVEGRMLEINPAQLGERIGLELPPLRRVTVGEHAAELEW